MREIKFRAKHKRTGKWWYGDSTLTYSPADQFRHYSLQVFWGYILRGVLDVDTVGEYAGQKDKNEVEIYEGDRVRWHTWDGYVGTEPVVFRDGYFFPTISKLKEVGTGNRFDESKGIEVIGNIYENPELKEDR